MSRGSDRRNSRPPSAGVFGNSSQIIATRANTCLHKLCWTVTDLSRTYAEMLDLFAIAALSNRSFTAGGRMMITRQTASAHAAPDGQHHLPTLYG